MNKAIFILVLISIVSGTGVEDICFGYNYFKDELSNSLILNCSHTLDHNIHIMIDDTMNTHQCIYDNLKFNSTEYTSSYPKLIELNNILISQSYNISEFTGYRGGGILSSLLPSKHISNTKQTYFHFINFLCNIGHISLETNYNTLKFDSTFLNSIISLPSTFNIDHENHPINDIQPFENFIDTYGSHMIFNAAFGGKITGFISTNKCKVDIDFRNNKTQFLKCLNNDFFDIIDENIDEYGCPYEFDASEYITNTNLKKIGGDSVAFPSYDSFNVEYDDKELEFNNFIDSLSIDTSIIIGSTHTIPFYDIIPYLYIPNINHQILIDISNAMSNAYKVIVNNTKRDMMNDIEYECDINECFEGNINNKMCKCVHCNGISCCKYDGPIGNGGGTDPFIDFNDGNELGIFIGICIGGIVLLVLLIFLILCCCNTRRNEKSDKSANDNTMDVTINMIDNSKKKDIKPEIDTVNVVETEGMNNEYKNESVNVVVKSTNNETMIVNNENKNENEIIDEIVKEEVTNNDINQNENESTSKDNNEDIEILPEQISEDINNEIEVPIIDDIDCKTNEQMVLEEHVNEDIIDNNNDEQEDENNEKEEIIPVIKDDMNNEIDNENTSDIEEDIDDNKDDVEIVNEEVINNNNNEPEQVVQMDDSNVNMDEKNEIIQDTNVEIEINDNTNVVELVNEEIIDDNNETEYVDNSNININENDEIMQYDNKVNEDEIDNKNNNEIEENIDDNTDDIEPVNEEVLDDNNDQKQMDDSNVNIDTNNEIIQNTNVEIAINDNIEINKNENENEYKDENEDINKQKKDNKKNKLKVDTFNGLLRASTERVKKINSKDFEDKNDGFLSRASTERVPKIIVSTGKRESLKSRTPTKKLKRGVAVTNDITNKSIASEIKKKGNRLKLQKEEQNAIQKKKNMNKGNGNKPHKSHFGQFYD